VPRLDKGVRAKADLIELWLYIGRDDRAAADRLLGRIDEQGRLLAGRPLIGRHRPEVAPTPGAGSLANT
jgi:toxin ParE1/3/4